MGLTILPPTPDPPSPTTHTNLQSPSSEDESMSSDNPDINSRPTKRQRLTNTKSSQIAIPGEIITSETQWMRGHGTFIPEESESVIYASLAGPVVKTNRLLTVPPMRARYSPSIGDLLLGRILTLSKSLWLVDISAPLPARLPLSSVNLPGGILRRRTTTDELQMRSYFQEGDLLVAEVQEVSSGGASLHTRSLKYGKLRNGVFLAVAGGVVRSKRQVFTLSTASCGQPGAGDIDIILGVNGYIWLSKHIDPHSSTATTNGTRTGTGANASMSISNLDDAVTSEIYSSQNDDIPEATRGEIARVAECIRVLVEGGVQVDEGAIVRAYESAVDWEMGNMQVDQDRSGGGGGVMSGEARKRILEGATG